MASDREGAGWGWRITLAKVAREGDVTAVPGAGLLTGAASGTWSPDPVSYQSYHFLRVGGPVIYEASCVFKFSGKKADEQPITGMSEVTLTATSKKLMGGRDHALVHGDSAEDSYGNRLEVGSAAAMRTS